MKSAAIISGCWQQHTHNAHVVALYDRINAYIHTHDHIETVWLNGEHINIHTNPWYHNTHQLLYVGQGVDWIRRAWTEPRPRSVFADMADTILNPPYHREQLIVWEGWQLEYMLNHTHPHIERLYYFGVGWDQGIKRDAVGWGHVCDMITHEHVKPRQLVTVPDCVLTNTETHADIEQFDFAEPTWAEHNWQLSQSDLYHKQDWLWT